MVLLTSLYVLWILTTALLIAISLIPLPKHILPRHRYLIMIIGTLVTDFPFFFLLIKSIVLFWFKSQGVFTHDPADADASLWSEWIYYADVFVFLGYWALTLQLYFAKNVVDNATAVYRNAESTDAPGVFTAGFWFRIMNPFWSPRHVKIHRDICYATQEELNFAGPGMEKYLSLDVYHHPSYPRNRPVLLYIHAGSYQSGSKSFLLPPFIYYLASQRWVVVSINTRLSPTVSYPTHLIDAKRALRWIRSNIQDFGGDPGFVAVAGTASGAHLASMLALTPNDPYYQPAFEKADTTVQCVVCVNGVMDVTDHRKIWGKGFPSFFAKKIARKDVEKDEDAEFLRLSSPVVLLKTLEMDRRKSVASGLGERVKADLAKQLEWKLPAGLNVGAALPPFLIFHGAADSMVPVRHVRDFVSTFKKVSKSTITYIEFPVANHMYNIMGCRSHYMAYGIQRFMRYMHEKYEDNTLVHAKME
ncbi:Alpha/Beta hydrolase protein [Chytridium lagenaria]|nr:Alpha/Beta hydrolase protein [Chytridium lagenaria]